MSIFVRGVGFSWKPSTALLHTPCQQKLACRKGVMSNRNYFDALAGLKLEDSASSSPTAAGASSRRAEAVEVAAPLSSSDKAEALKKGGVQQEAAAAAEAGAAASTSSSPDGTSQDAASRRSSDKPSDPKKVPSALVWIDLEMTGLDPDKDTIIEIACLITNSDLTRVWEGPNIVIHHPESVLDNMNEWCKDHHNKSGLVQKVRESTTSLQAAEQEVLAFVQEHTEYQQPQLAGNSVHVDRVFLQRHMPELLDHLHYRIVDVSTVKELCRRWRPRVYRQAPRKVTAHTALSDIRESLKELQYYKQALFRGK